MNKRLRKKRHLGEFKEFGFSISLKLRPDLAESELDVYFNDFLDTVERLNLAVGGGGQYDLDFFCTRLKGRTPITLEDRDALEKWLAQDSRLVSFQLGDLEDAWYP